MFRKITFSIKKLNFYLLFVLFPFQIWAQQSDSLPHESFSIHAQATVITQTKPGFSARYSGKNSLSPNAETRLSYTSTLFLSGRLWSGGSLTINPEVAGGSGLSGSVGVGASTNGESYRIDNPMPTFDLARIFLRQYIPLTKETVYIPAGFNTLAGIIPQRYISVIIGKISVADFFDNNTYSHDPRTQFMSWALMSNGAWDFPANTRGYTPSLVLEYVTPKNELRYGFSLVPMEANGMKMNWNIRMAGSHTLEYTRNYNFNGIKGALRLVSFFTTANMGNYNQSLALYTSRPDVIATERTGNTKYGFGINSEQSLTKDLGLFMRASWNDGNNETWAFTEMDRSLSFGLSSAGRKWNRPADYMGFALVTSGLSISHRNYLKAGGSGFELGDGNLNYGTEALAEYYYSLAISKNIFLSGAYQFILNPGYNKDRGPVNVFSVRVHLVI